MAEIDTEITFHNKAKIRVQAQIFSGRTLISTCLADPDEVRILSGGPVRYDIFLKNSATGRELARKLESESTTVTLSQIRGYYIIT